MNPFSTSEDASSGATDCSQMPLLDLSPFEGLPRSSCSSLLSLFYSPYNNGCGSHQLQEIRVALEGGETGDSQIISYKLHQLAGSSLQAGALRLGVMAKAHRAAQSLRTVDDVAGLAAVLNETVSELQQQGYLAAPDQPPLPSSPAGPVSAIKQSTLTSHGSFSTDSGNTSTDSGFWGGSFASAKIGSGRGTTPVDRTESYKLFESQQFEGLPASAISRLLSLYYSTAPITGSAAIQLQELKAALQGGDASDSPSISHKLHQLAGSSMQAGAMRLGAMAKAYRATQSLRSGEDVDRLAAVLEETRASLREGGLLQPE
jgi:HPt (histidine-containing phosphotransfer) domain-containing protein